MICDEIHQNRQLSPKWQGNKAVKFVICMSMSPYHCCDRLTLVREWSLLSFTLVILGSPRSLLPNTIPYTNQERSPMGSDCLCQRHIDRSLLLTAFLKIFFFTIDPKLSHRSFVLVQNLRHFVSGRYFLKNHSNPHKILAICQ